MNRFLKVYCSERSPPHPTNDLDFKVMKESVYLFFLRQEGAPQSSGKISSMIRQVEADVVSGWAAKLMMDTQKCFLEEGNCMEFPAMLIMMLVYWKIAYCSVAMCSLFEMVVRVKLMLENFFRQCKKCYTAVFATDRVYEPMIVCFSFSETFYDQMSNRTKLFHLSPISIWWGTLFPPRKRNRWACYFMEKGFVK